MRQLSISEQTSYRWKKLHRGLQPDQALELKQLQDENALLKTSGCRAESGQGDSAGCRNKRMGPPALKKLAVHEHLLAGRESGGCVPRP